MTVFHLVNFIVCVHYFKATFCNLQDNVEQKQTEAAFQEKSAAARTFGNQGGDDGQNQTSFIVVDNAHEVAPPEGGNTVRKSDKSSDESSYDVVDDDRMAEMEEDEEEKEDVEDANASAKGPVYKSAGDRLGLESSLETSMVIVEEAERSNIEKSGSSFYTSADENFGMTHLEDSSKLNKDEEDEKTKSDQKVIEISMTEDESTVMYKTGSVGNDTVTLEGKDSSNDVTPVVEEFVVAGDEESKDEQAQEHIDDPAIQAKLESHAITDAVLRADLEAVPVDAAVGEAQTPSQAEQELNLADVTEVLSKCQSTPMSVTKEDIDLLVYLLRKNMPELQATVLNSIVRIAAFNQNTVSSYQCFLSNHM